MRLTERFDRAFLFASELHRDQIRKGTRVPYLAHLLAVTAIVLENGAEEETAIAALLHDAEAIPKPPWRERKEAYITHVAEAPEAVRLVSCADKLHNARAILFDYRAVGEAIWERFTGGRAGTLWYYRALADIFLETGPFPLAEELNRVVQEMEALSGENSRETTAF